MKRMFKIGWLVLIVGLVALMIGYLNHGDRNVDFHNGRPRVQRQASWRLTNRRFDKVNLDVTTANVRIKRGAAFRVNYHGLTKNKPIVVKRGHTLVIKQPDNDRGFYFHINGFDDQLTITLPRDAQINGGTIKMGSGDLDINGVDLDDTKIDVASGDVDLDNLTLSGGHAELNSGDFTAHQLRVRGYYRVNNDSGDNEVHAAGIDGYRLQTTSGDNAVNDHDRDQDTVEDNMTADNTLELITQSGDNEYDN
ncbi:MAG: DUF4097 family beta strand repeat-containing protein [Lactobacillaceae bacterium]|nr:DUF4097 family beta strand repeat-containing protein [Lactobacillaceae bacterium]